LTGTIVFQRLGVEVEQVLIDQQSALQKLQSGEVAALVRVVGKPVEFFSRIPPNSGLHLVPTRSRRCLPTTTRWASSKRKIILRSSAREKRRHHRGTGGSCGVQLAEGQRPLSAHRALHRALFTKWEGFQVAPRHPKWRDVNLAATVPGWSRYPLAEQMLQRLRGRPLQVENI
jgi:hypothetical protein